MLAQGDIYNLRVIHDHQFNDLGMAADVCAGLRGLRTQFHQCLDRLGPEVMHHEVEAVSGKVDGHGLADVAQTDEADARGHDPPPDSSPAPCRSTSA